MGYGFRDGDIISLANDKAGALTMSTNLLDYRGTELDPETLWETQPAVRTVVDFITTTIAGIPFDLYERQADGGRTRNYQHRVARALSKPGYRLGQKRWVQQLLHDRMVHDRWAVIIQELEGGGLELIRMPAERITLITDGIGRFTELGIWTEGSLRTRPLDDVIFDVGVGPTKKDRKPGHSVLRTLSDLARELDGMSEYRANLFRNSAMVPAVIERPTDAPKWTDDAWKRFKSEFSTYRAGGGNAGGTPILEDGMQLKPVDVFNPKDSQYIEVRQLALIEAAQAVRIPPELVGAKDGTHSNIVALREQLYVDVLGPEIGFFEDALNTGLADYMGPEQYIEANIAVKLRGSLIDRAKIYQTASGRPWLTTNEVRAMENKPAIEGGDELATPLNVASGAQASPTDTAPDDDERDDDDDELKAVGTGPKGSGRKAAAPKNKWAPVDRAAARLEQQALEWWHQAARNIADYFGVDLEAEPGGKALNNDALPALPDREETLWEAQVLANTLLTATKDVAEAGANVVLTEFNPDSEGFDMQKQAAWLAQAAKTNTQKLDQWIWDELANVMHDPSAWQEGLRRALNSDAEVQRWATAAATEAASFGGLDAAKASGLTRKTWITVSKNPRPSHQRQNGMTVDLDDSFPNGQRYPGDWWGEINEVANCNCRMDYGK
jgi:HK97 family phage portal protein